MSKKNSRVYQYQKEEEEKEKKEEKQNKLKKYSWFELILYPQDNELNHNKDILDFIVNNKYLYKRYIYIVHDRDVDEEGQIKKSHVHLIFKASEKYTVPGIIKQFCYLNENQVIGIEHLRQAILYLTHETFQAKIEGKTQYKKEELVGDTDIITEIRQNLYFTQNVIISMIEESPYTIDVLDKIEDSEEKELLKQEFFKKPAFYQRICTEERVRRSLINKEKEV